MAAVANKQNSLGKFRSVINRNLKNIPFVGLLFRLVTKQKIDSLKIIFYIN